MGGFKVCQLIQYDNGTIIHCFRWNAKLPPKFGLLLLVGFILLFESELQAEAAISWKIFVLYIKNFLFIGFNVTI